MMIVICDQKRSPSKGCAFFVNFPATVSSAICSDTGENLFSNKKLSNMTVMKVIEIMADSPKSWDDATARGIKKASKSIKNIKSAWVQSQSVVVKDGKVSAYRVSLKVSFQVGE